MKTVLITGATGFIGGYVIDELLKTNLNLIASSRDENKAKKMSWYNKLTYIPIDLESFQPDVYTFCHKPDIVVDLAWQGLPNYNELFHFEKNTMTHYNFLKTMIENGCHDVVSIGTCFEYGLVDGEIEETAVTNPQTAYGLAKDTLRRYLQILQLHEQFKLSWLRLFYVYGKGQSQKSLYSLIQSAVANNDKEFNMSPGQQIRDFVHASVVAKYIARIVVNELDCGVINCGSGTPKSVENFVRECLSEYRYSMKLNLGYYPYNSYEPMSFWASTKKMKQLLK